MNFKPLQKGDMINTSSSTKNLSNYIKIKKTISYKIGIKKFIDWYKDYYGIS